MNRTPRLSLLAAALPLLAALPLSAQTPAHAHGAPGATPQADSAAVAAAVDRYHQALSSADSAGALALLTADAVILESGGVESRAEYRSHHLRSDIGSRGRSAAPAGRCGSGCTGTSPGPARPARPRGNSGAGRSTPRAPS